MTIVHFPFLPVEVYNYYTVMYLQFFPPLAQQLSIIMLCSTQQY